MNTIGLAWPGAVCLAMAALWNETDLTATEIAEKVGALLGREVSKNSVLGQVFRMRKRGFVMKRKGPTMEARMQPKSAAKLEASFEGWPQKGECCWPMGDPREKDFRFCCEKRGSDHRYCDEHYRIAFRGPGEER